MAYLKHSKSVDDFFPISNLNGEFESVLLFRSNMYAHVLDMDHSVRRRFSDKAYRANQG
jgi:hypothetical protein